MAVTPAARLVVTEGNYLLLSDSPWRAASAACEETWWVDVGDDLRLHRLVARNVTFGKTPDAARAWVTGSDEADAAVIRERGGEPELRVSVG